MHCGKYIDDIPILIPVAQVRQYANYIQTIWLNKHNKQNNFIIKKLISCEHLTDVEIHGANPPFKDCIVNYRIEFVGLYIYPNMCVNIKDLKYKIDSQDSKTFSKITVTIDGFQFSAVMYDNGYGTNIYHVKFDKGLELCFD